MLRMGGQLPVCNWQLPVLRRLRCAGQAQGCPNIIVAFFYFFAHLAIDNQSFIINHCRIDVVLSRTHREFDG